MMTASETADRTRSLLDMLVRRQEQRSGSRMAAYGEVGSLVGMTASWVRKFLGRQDVTLHGHALVNIAEAYARLCDRIEADAEHDRQVAARLREVANAAFASTLDALDGVESAPIGGKDGAARVSRPGHLPGAKS